MLLKQDPSIIAGITELQSEMATFFGKVGLVHNLGPAVDTACVLDIMSNGMSSRYIRNNPVAMSKVNNPKGGCDETQV